MRNPTSLILKLRGVGAWHLRKKRMDLVVREYPDRGLVRTREEFDTESGWEEYLEKHNQYKIFQERLVEYDKYLEIKKEINAKRRETQVLLEPDKGENGRFKSS